MGVGVGGLVEPISNFDVEFKFAFKKEKKKKIVAKNFLSFRAKIGTVLFWILNTEWFEPQLSAFLAEVVGKSPSRLTHHVNDQQVPCSWVLDLSVTPEYDKVKRFNSDRTTTCW